MADEANETLNQEMTARTMAPPGASQDLFLRALQPVFAARFRTRLIVDNVPAETVCGPRRRPRTTRRTVGTFSSPPPRQ